MVKNLCERNRIGPAVRWECVFSRLPRLTPSWSALSHRDEAYDTWPPRLHDENEPTLAFEELADVVWIGSSLRVQTPFLLLRLRREMRGLVAQHGSEGLQTSFSVTVAATLFFLGTESDGTRRYRIENGIFPGYDGYAFEARLLNNNERFNRKVRAGKPYYILPGQTLDVTFMRFKGTSEMMQWEFVKPVDDNLPRQTDDIDAGRVWRAAEILRLTPPQRVRLLRALQPVDAYELARLQEYTRRRPICDFKPAEESAVDVECRLMSSILLHERSSAGCEDIRSEYVEILKFINLTRPIRLEALLDDYDYYCITRSLARVQLRTAKDALSYVTKFSKENPHRGSLPTIREGRSLNLGDNLRPLRSA